MARPAGLSTRFFGAYLLARELAPHRRVVEVTDTDGLDSSMLRAVGGWLSDKYGAHSVTWWVLWVSWVCLFLLSYPQTDFTVLTVDGPRTFHVGLNAAAFTGLMFLLGIAWAFGKASVFKYIGDDFPSNIGTVSGIG